MKSQSATHEFVNSLVRHVPDLQDVYNEHFADYDGILPHVFMADVTRFIIDKLNDSDTRSHTVVRDILNYLDKAIDKGGMDVRELISASFVENIEDCSEVVSIIWPWLGVNLKKEFNTSST